MVDPSLVKTCPLNYGKSGLSALEKRWLFGGVDCVVVLNFTHSLEFVLDVCNAPVWEEAYRKLPVLLTTVLHCKEGSADLNEPGVVKWIFWPTQTEWLCSLPLLPLQTTVLKQCRKSTLLFTSLCLLIDPVENRLERIQVQTVVEARTCFEWSCTWRQWPGQVDQDQDYFYCTFFLSFYKWKLTYFIIY